MVPLNGLPSIYHSTVGDGFPSAAQFTVPDSPTLTLLSTGGLTHLGLAGTKRRNHCHIATYRQKTHYSYWVGYLNIRWTTIFRGFRCCVDLRNWMYTEMQPLIHILFIISYFSQNLHYDMLETLIFYQIHENWYPQILRKSKRNCFKILTSVSL